MKLFLAFLVLIFFFYVSCQVPCATITDCLDCANNRTCGWCSFEGICQNRTNGANTACPGGGLFIDFLNTVPCKCAANSIPINSGSVNETECNTCVSTPDTICNFCPSGNLAGVCILQSSSGPYNCTWAQSPPDCINKTALCSSYSACGPCSTDQYCSWCFNGQTCVVRQQPGTPSCPGDTSINLPSICVVPSPPAPNNTNTIIISVVVVVGVIALTLIIVGAIIIKRRRDRPNL